MRITTGGDNDIECCDDCCSPGVLGPLQTAGGTLLGPSGPDRMDPIARGPEHGNDDNDNNNNDNDIKNKDFNVNSDLVKTRIHLGPIQVLGHV